MSEYNPVLSAPRGANKNPKRVGRGSSSGLGTTAGKGNKGQQSRSGSAQPYVGFEVVRCHFTDALHVADSQTILLRKNLFVLMLVCLMQNMLTAKQ